MSLRWRLALALAAVSLLASAGIAVVAYRLTASELVGQVDLDLQLVVTQLELPPPPPGTPPTLPKLMPGELLLPASPIATTAPSGSPPVAAVQHLSPTGAIDAGNDVLRIPVSSVDLDIARHGGQPYARDETIGGVAYRVLTAGTRPRGALQVAISLSAVDAALHAILWRYLVGAVIVALIGAAIGWLVARRIARPLERLASAAAAVGRTGVLALDVDRGRDDETGRLTRAIDEMLASLRRSRLEQERLVQDAGHELRTPLTSVCSNVELLALRDDRLDEAARSRLLASARQELGRLVTLVNELIELATDTARDEQPTTVAMDELVRLAADGCAMRSGRTILVEGEPWEVEGRPNALERAVANLLENAVKFSPAGTPIEVDASPGRIAVRDHGPGIDTAELTRVFDRFHRGPTAASVPGSGLGLSIVRKVALFHDGSVFAANAPGGGAIVGFELVVRPAGRSGAP